VLTADLYDSSQVLRRNVRVESKLNEVEACCPSKAAKEAQSMEIQGPNRGPKEARDASFEKPNGLGGPVATAG